eukprot:2906726-Amphidinium_carterae.1
MVSPCMSPYWADRSTCARVQSWQRHEGTPSRLARDAQVRGILSESPTCEQSQFESWPHNALGSCKKKSTLF